MHIKKVLRLINLQVNWVLTEITGLSGLRILDVFLQGNRDPLTIAPLYHERVNTCRRYRIRAGKRSCRQAGPSVVMSI